MGRLFSRYAGPLDRLISTPFGRRYGNTSSLLRALRGLSSKNQVVRRSHIGETTFVEDIAHSVLIDFSQLLRDFVEVGALLIRPWKLFSQRGDLYQNFQRLELRE